MAEAKKLIIIYELTLRLIKNDIQIVNLAQVGKAHTEVPNFSNPCQRSCENSKETLCCCGRGIVYSNIGHYHFKKITQS